MVGALAKIQAASSIHMQTACLDLVMHRISTSLME